MTFEQLAAWLAGGLAQPVDDDALREAITAVLPDVREDSHWKGQGPATAFAQPAALGLDVR